MAFTSVDLSTYVRVGRYDLPEPTRTTPPTNSVLAQEASAVTYNKDTDTLFVLGDGGTSIVQVSKTGQLIDSMTLAPSEFADPEGLTYIGNGKFALVEERVRQVSSFTYTANTTLTKANAQTVKLGTTIGNIGIEGISYDPQTGGFIAVKEISPEGIFQTGIDFAAGTATNGSSTTDNSINLFDPAKANLGDFADVFALSNLSALNGQTDSSHLLILSQESGKIVNVDRAGNISSSLTIYYDAGNPSSIQDQQHEGLTMDNNGVLYVVSENGGGDINHPQLWVYAPTTATNQAPTGISLNNKLNAILENTATTTRLKVADIAIADDGLGPNTLSVSGADASAFEADSTGLYIKAGTTLDFETKTSYSINVNVDDATVGNSPDATTSYTLSVTDIPNESAATTSTIFITEVAPWSSGNSPVAADWFELTNKGTSAVDITGWKFDDNSNSFGSAVALSGITSIGAGESVIFIEGATANANFRSNWFGANSPANLQIGYYSGSGVGLSTGGDAVNIFNATGTLQANVLFLLSPSAAPFATFDNATLSNNANISTLSSVGVNGAFVAANSSVEIGSPGAIATIVTIAATDANAAEAGPDTGTFRISRTADTTNALTVNYTVDTGVGKATSGDFTPTLTGSVVIAAGKSFVDIAIAPIDDTSVEGNETVTINLSDTANYDLGSSSSATVIIADSNVNPLGFSGVAAGDATSNDVILWTRTFDSVTKKGDNANLIAQVSTDSNFATIAFTYNVPAKLDGLDHDGTVKVDATGLQSGTKYYYRFQTAAGNFSNVGTFKTAPDATKQTAVRFGFSGDADGLMRPYSSTQTFGSLNLDFFGFLGDTIYETASTGSAAVINTDSASLTQSQLLIDYHRKYLENIQPVNAGGFSGLETLFTSQGNYTLLDNHELGNKQIINGGAPLALANKSGNGSSVTTDDVNTTGTFINDSASFKTLVQAYSDYQPIKEKIISAPNDARTDGTQQLYTSQQWSENVLYISTDTRSYRDVRLKTAAGADDTGARANNPDRTLLGKTQLAWLKQTLLDAQTNGTIWKFVAVSDPIDQIGAIGSGADGGKSWIGGYRAERNDLLKFIADNGIKNVVFLSTDDHQNRINELTYWDNASDIGDQSKAKVLQGVLSVVDGPIGATQVSGATGVIDDHSFSNIKSLADTLANTQTTAGVNPIGLDPANFTGLKNVKREGDTNADATTGIIANNKLQAVDFYSPDTFNFTTFDISADGKTLNVNVQGINSYGLNTFQEPTASNPVRSILSFTLDATPATLSVTASTPTGTEANSTSGVFTIASDSKANTDLTFNYTVSGTATNGVDYTSLTGTATIAAGQSSVTIAVTPVDDQLGEGTETAILTLASGSGYSNSATKSSATVSIIDNDFTPVKTTSGDDNLLDATSDPKFDGLSNTIFTGAGNDNVDFTSFSGSAVGNNRVDLGSGNDTIYVSQNDRVFGGDGDDIFEATEGKGGNRMFGGAGNDKFYLGFGDRALGGDGIDTFFVSSGGNNLLSGGAGADIFNIITGGTAPSAKNIILDFQAGIDSIGIRGGSITLNDLIRSSNDISYKGSVVATLLGVDTSTLTAANFQFS